MFPLGATNDNNFDNLYFRWILVDGVKVSVGDCVFVKLVEGVQMGRITSLYQDTHHTVRLKLFRFYFEEEMFVTKRESLTIHGNEAFASDFLIHALASQIDEKIDVVYLKKKEKIPPLEQIPQGT